jgi:SAM-dependent methyltransferase
MARPWYEELYDGLEGYDQETYAQGTQAEVDFIERIIGYDRSKVILDVGCGTGRHALELSRRGYSVVGIDLSLSMLAKGREIALVEQLGVKFVEGDARTMAFSEDFDIAIMLCEGAFSLVESDEMDRLILSQVARALRPEGTLIMTAPNAAYMFVRQGSANEFDPVTLREAFTLEKVDTQGNRRLLDCTQRYYTCPELNWLLKEAGFREIEFFAVKDTGYERHGQPFPAHFELGAIALK